MGKALVIVESPTKAKTIRKFLPKDFKVVASMGHVRDLPQSASDIPKELKAEAWTKIGVNVENDFEPLYLIPKNKAKVISELKKDLKEAEELYLATDEDREGESISWHLLQLLKPKVPVKRMVFHEITREAIQHALQECRGIDQRLVSAQETRRILDRLVGYSVSPLIWKKIAYGLSAGRVQSAGLRLIVERERARLRFKKGTYWDLLAQLEKTGQPFESKLFSVRGKRIATGKDFDELTGQIIASKDVYLLGEAEAKTLVGELKSRDWKVEEIEEKKQRSHPAPPFITSTLQQEANRKLGMSAGEAMRAAQRLYEEGLITYMRTDSVHLSNEGLNGARRCVRDLYGPEYLSPEPRQYKSKSKSAQEAHEAIRPAGSNFVHPKETGLNGKEAALYELIWKRTVACQMAEAEKLSLSVKISAGDCLFTASGSRILFPGFLRAYVEGSDDPDAALEEREVLLPPLQKGDILGLKSLEAMDHETKPPARYTEASLVQTLEKEGIGRPSTYASIIGTILDRGYVRKIGNALAPTFTGFAVTQFLERHFGSLVDYGFTSQMEEDLDAIAEGQKDSLPYLRNFFLGKAGLQQQVQEGEKKIDPETSRTVDFQGIDGVKIKVGRFGPYVVREGGKTQEEERASLPEDLPPAELSAEKVEEIFKMSKEGAQALGRDPKTGMNVYCLSGRYGPYVQLGEATDEKQKPKRVSVPKNIDPQKITFEQALALVQLPRELGEHPETGEKISVNIGRFGPYVVHQKDFRSLKKDDDIFTIGLARALELLSEPKRGRGNAKLIREIGPHPKDQKIIAIYEGRFGPYLKHASTNASLPKDQDPSVVTLEEAVTYLENRKSKGKKRRASKAS